MSAGAQGRDSWTRRLGARLVILSLLFGWVAGCAQVSTPTESSIPSPTVPVESTPLSPSGWETYTSQGQCGYVISHPADMQGASQDMYSWILSPSLTEPSGPVPNFVYVSVIPDELRNGGEEIIYNYNPAEAETLLNMQVGESKPLRDDPNTAPWFTYTRLPDTILNTHTAQAYENTQPWEFPPGIKEIRYYLQGNSCTYLIGGYMDTTGSNQSGAINEELFNQIISMFRLTP